MAKAQLCRMDGWDRPVDCGKAADRRGRCQQHYMQWFRRQTKCKEAGCKRLTAGHGYCRPHERLALSTRTPAAQAASLDRFRRGIEPDSVTGCWLWQERPNESGYPLFHAGGAWLAHRFAYVWFAGGHKPRHVLDHLCNQPLCVRPDHLLPMTNTNNLALRRQRDEAECTEFWRHSAMTPNYLSAILWAAKVGLPYSKPDPCRSHR